MSASMSPCRCSSSSAIQRAQEARSLKVSKDLKQLHQYVSDELSLRERAVAAQVLRA